MIHDRNAASEIAENLGILFGTTLASYLFGKVITMLIPVKLPVG